MENKNYLPEKFCNLDFKKEITSWDEAIPLGNGESGCLVWGKSEAFRMSLDRTDLWDTTPSPEILEKDYKYKNLVKYAKLGDIKNINSKYSDSYRIHPNPTKLPAGKIIFNFGKSTAIHSYLSLADALCTVRIFNGKEETFKIETYCHATQKVGIIRISKPLSEFSFKLENPEFGVKGDKESIEEIKKSSISIGSLKLLEYDLPEIVNEPERKSFVQKISDDFAYGVFIAAKEQGDETCIAYRIATCRDGENWIEDAKTLVEHFANAEKSETFRDHALWWDEYWAKSGISLPDKFFEKNWYLTNYLFASCSRKGCYPMPLQGVWTADNGCLPPWKGDYHNDLNTQLSYTHYMKANHLQEGESFIDFLWNLVPKAEKFAHDFYETDGICLPSIMSIDGKPLGGWPMYSLSPTNQLWLCQMFERHYRATGDVDFLREKAYPYMKESTRCVLELMETHGDGKLYLPVSSSPEIHDNSLKSWLTPNSNYDLSLIRYTVTELIDFSKILDNGETEKWQEVLLKLPELAVDDNNVLMLSPDESLQESHRHFSHAMAIHPLRLLSYENETERKIIDATIQNLEVFGTGSWVGFSFTWMAELYAVQENGNGAAYQLEVFWRNTCSQNGFHLNGDFKKRGTSKFHYRPFTLESNMCAVDALQEMLLYSEKGELKFFPAIPEEWKEEPLSFRDFLAGNGLLVSAERKDGKIISVTMKPAHTQTVIIKNWKDLSNLKVSGAEVYADGEQAKLNLKKGVICTMN